MKLISKSISTFQGLMRKSIGYLTGTTLADVLQEEGTPAGRNQRPSHPYSQLAPVYACIKLIQETFSGLPVRVSNANDDILEDGPAVGLLERPNPKQTGTQFRRNYAAYMQIFGRCYFHTPGVPTDSSLPVTEVYCINPIQMDAEFDARGDVYRWRYVPKANVGGYLYLDPKEVHEIYSPDHERIDMPGESLAPRMVIAQAIAQYFKADLANEASLDNGVEPGGMFTTPGELSEGQRKDFKQQIREKHQGVMNRRRFMLLEGGMEFLPSSANFREMEFPTLKMMSREDICVAYGVTSLLLGYTSGQQGIGSGKELESHDRRFHLNTISPMTVQFGEEWDLFVTARTARDRSLSQRSNVVRKNTRRAVVTKNYKTAKFKAAAYDRNVFTWFDMSAIPAIQQAALELANQAQTWTEVGATYNDIVEAFDLPFDTKPWGNTWYKPMGLTDVQAEDPLRLEPTGATTPGREEPATQDPAAVDDAAATQDKQIHQLITKALTEPQRRKLWEAWRRSWTGIESATRSKVARHFMELRTEVLGNLRKTNLKTLTASGIQTKDLVGQLLFDLVNANNKLIVKMQPLIIQSIQLGGTQVMAEAAASSASDTVAAFNMDDPATIAAIRKRTVAITTVNRTMQDRLRKAIANSVANGEGAEQITKAIQHQFNIATSSQARTIAYTEIGGAVEEARQIGYQQAGIELRSWLWSRAETGRRNHASTESATMAHPVKLTENFVISGSGVTTPHPRGSGVASEDVNCGCSTIARFADPKKDLRLLTHLHTKGFTHADQIKTMIRKDAA